MKDRIASRLGLLGILVLFVMLAVTSVSAAPAANAVYFVPGDITASGCGDVQNVELWMNTSAGVANGQVTFNYDPACANVTWAHKDPLVWPQGGVNYDVTPGLVIVTFGSGTSQSGETKILNMTINCTDCSGNCGTLLAIDTSGTPPNSDLTGATNVNWINGTFLCGDAIAVTKTVWDGSGWVNALPARPSAYNGTDVTFNITVTAGCIGMSNVVINDTMGDRLQYNNSASWASDSNTAQTVNWTIGTLNAGESNTTIFNATIIGYGLSCNTAAVTATVNGIGIEVDASDDACVTTMAPAGFDVNKTVWDASVGAWVEMINVTMTNDPAQDTYRFRCEIENTGSPTMDICDMVVTDVLPANLEYADNAELRDHHGVMWTLPNPPDINDSTNNTYGWIINNTVPGECLQPGQMIVVEYDVTVVNYGLGCNEMTADGWCNESGVWVDENDSACINVLKPDLNVTAGNSIKVNPDVPYLCDMAFGPTDHPGNRTQCNNISAEVQECNGVDIFVQFNVTIVVTNSTSGDVDATCTTTLPGLAGGTNVTVWCNNSWYPIAGWDYTINVTADTEDAVPESYEDNNTLLRDVTPYVYGWKGNSHQDGRNITTLQYHNGTINLAYSVDNTRMSAYYHPNWTDFNRTFPASDFSAIPTTSTSIKKARLYVYYDWDKSSGQNITDYFTLDFNGYGRVQDGVYIDRKTPDLPLSGLCSGSCCAPRCINTSNAAYGMVAYNVTHKLKLDGSDNIAHLHNSYPGGGNVSSYGMLLVVVYNNPSEPERIIWINEGFDMLKSGLTTYDKVGSTYIYGPTGITPEEATTYAPFVGCPIPADNKASLITVVTGATAGAADEKNKGHSLYFNDVLLGMDDVWSSGVGVTETEIPASLLESTDNTAKFRSYGDGFEPANAFLIVEDAGAEMSVEPVPSASGKPCYDVGEEFDVLINLDPLGESIMGAEFDLDFDKDVIFAETVTYGGFLTQDGHTSIYIAETVVDNDNGVVMFAASRQSASNGVTNPGTFAIVHFTAVAEGQISYLNLVDALAANDAYPVETITLATINGNVEICFNEPPIAVAKSDFTYNNLAERGLSKAYFSGTDSSDPDGGDLTLWNWWVDDGTDLIGENVVHLFEAPIYWQPMGDPNGGYVPADVTLTVTDDGMPLKDGLHTIHVDVWIAGDTTGDGRVNIADTVPFGRQFGEHANTGPDGLHWHDNLEGDQADLNNDDWVNIGDATLLGTAWGHTAW